MLITIIWLIFANYFAILVIFHFRQAKTNYPKFDPSIDIKTGDPSSVNATATIHETKLVKFFNEFNNYVENNNSNNRKTHMYEGLSYIVSAAVSFFSAYLSLS